MAQTPVVLEVTSNSRNLPEISVHGKHLSIPELEQQIQKDDTIWERYSKVVQLLQLPLDKHRSKTYINKPKIMDYLDKNIPSYPTPVEFHVANVAHVTAEKPVRSIWETEEFRPPETEFSWWDLKITEEEINSAEKRYLEKKHLNEAGGGQETVFLNKFTTSPLFQTHQSRYGSYRFSFPLAELMELYKEQNCKGDEPVLRIYKTIFYKQEIVYAVLVHSSEHNEKFKDLPKLPKTGIVSYDDGKIIWNAQAISETHMYELTSNLELKKQANPQFYVWDQVSVVFHLPLDVPTQIKVTKQRLLNALEPCEIDAIDLRKLKLKLREDPNVLLKEFQMEVEHMKEEVSESGEVVKEQSSVNIKTEIND